MSRRTPWILLTLIGLMWVAGLNGCSCSGPPATSTVLIVVTSGSGQMATVNTAFANPLMATVTTNGSPASGVLVTFTPPGSGASATFPNGKTATTNSSGVASLAVSANTKAGGPYTVAATAPGAAAPANFSLTNNAGAPASITATSGTPQSTFVGTPFAAPLVATVEDSFQNPVNGATVSFTPPAGGASATFAGGVNTAATNASGAATSAVVSANGTGGGPYTVAATVTGAGAPANFSLTNVPPQNFTFYLSGQEAINGGPNFYALVGVIAINPISGAVLGGEQDYNDGVGITSPQPSGDTITTGTLSVNSATGQGMLTLTTSDSRLGVNGTETFGVQFVNSNHALIIQFDGSATSSGSMDLQTLPAVVEAVAQARTSSRGGIRPLDGVTLSAPTGAFAFTTSGEDAFQNAVVSGGVFTLTGNGDGTSSLSGTIDTDDTGAQFPTFGTSFTATLTAPDPFGRGQVTNLSVDSLGAAVNYYIVGPEVIRVINVDVNDGDAGVGSAFGQGTSAGAFSNASLGPSVFAFGSNSEPVQNTYAAAGMLATTPSPESRVVRPEGVIIPPGDGTFQGFADSDVEGSVQSSAVSGTYSIGSNGYGSLTVTNGGLGDTTLLGIYAVDPNLNINDPNNATSGLGGALVADLDEPVAGTGFLVPQTDTSTSSFLSNSGAYAFGAQDLFAAVVDTQNLSEEFDFVGQGPITGGALSGTGIISDPFFENNVFSGSNALDSGVMFTGAPAADMANPGRYTMFPGNDNPLFITVAGSMHPYTVVIYQASGAQLFWLDEEAGTLFLGPLELQSTPPPFPGGTAEK